MDMRILTFRSDDGPRAGICIGNQVFDVAKLLDEPRFASVRGILDAWEETLPRLRAAAKQPREEGRPLASLDLLACVHYPGAIYCAGANYSDHAANMARRQNMEPEPDPHTLGLKPWHFLKASWCAVGQNAEVELECNFLDWEAELAVVIGKTARNIPIDKVQDHIAGYTIANDLSARDRSVRPPVPVHSPFRFDWIGQKNFDGACPLGPWIVPVDEIPDAQALSIRTYVNDALKQDSNSSRMIFDIAEQVAHISSRITLHPGDVVLTGTPAGVGAETNECLKRGDVVRVEIEKIGELVTRIV